VVGEDHEFAALHVGPQAAGRVGEQERLHAEGREQFDAAGEHLGGVPLVAVHAALQERRRHAADRAAGDAARVAGGGGPRQPARVRGRRRPRVGEPVDEAAQAGAEHGPDPRPRGPRG
jgi:hypothetical protein